MSSTILIVDDERIGRDTLEAFLEGESYQIALAENGPKALAIARELQPDVILLDVMMPGMTGFEVCRQIRNDALLAEIPVILVTALDDRESLILGLNSGADDFLTKPIDRLELRARLSGIVRLNRYRKLMNERANLEQANKDLEQANQDLMRAYDATIDGWSHALDLRDKETEGHSMRVTELTMRLARKLGLSSDDMVQIRRGAQLHDIGKLGIPDAILLKPGKLTDEEWQTMRLHPLLGYEMLRKIEYLGPALDIPYCHHEKWDGSGYPRGLRGEQIPLPARMFALADVWDALLSDRPYRQAWSKEKTLEFMRGQVGTHFDPHIAETFFAMVAEA